MKSARKFYIKERNNPQLKKPYYVGLGQLSKRAAKSRESAIYGSNSVLEYDDEARYREALEGFKKQGFSVYND